MKKRKEMSFCKKDLVEESKTKKCTGVMFVFTQNIDRRCKPSLIVNQLKSAGLRTAGFTYSAVQKSDRW